MMPNPWVGRICGLFLFGLLGLQRRTVLIYTSILGLFCSGIQYWASVLGFKGVSEVHNGCSTPL
ncbi:hypothetical protein B0T21DRAFT_375561 [Apiosordaria backusii]|uniref:Uncharacterized protein n=1 Tax=Apiosordaria backusii TaxID=314023 RepID=A0AA40AEA0_9PEZI|nr:hypothetical protein B0T21DRAFT_375561 [Apiosordaria backusii]